MKKHQLLVALFASMALAGWSQEIIIESYSDGKNSQDFSQEGKWTDSTAKSTADGLTATKALFNDANTDPGSARFTPEIPAAGKYEVFITYPMSGNASGIKYTVVSADGTKELSLNQNGRDLSAAPASNQWYSLGSFNFAAGKTGYVELSDPLTGEKPLANEPNARIYADAVKFVPEGASAVVVASATPASAVATAAPAAAELPSLPGAVSSTPAGTDMPGLPEVQAAGKKDDAMPALPSTPAAPEAAAALPGLPSTPAAESAAADLPALPGATSATPAVTDGMPALPAAPPTDIAQANMPALPANTPATNGMPSLPPAPATADAMPELPSAPGTSDVMPDLPATAAAATPASTPYPAPNLPSLAPVTPTPIRNMPTVKDTPVSGQISGLPGGALNNLPPTPTMPTSGVYGTPAPFNPTMPDAPGMQTPGNAMAATPAPGSYSITSYNPANLQWMYDFGAALNSARDQNKKVIVFFTSEGNRAGQTYENQYFTDPSVRQALDNFVLVKIDFSQNTRLAYSLGVFGAGVVVVADSTGTVISRVIQLPPTPVDLLKQMAGSKPAATPVGAIPAATPAAGLPGTEMGTTPTAAAPASSAANVPL